MHCTVLNTALYCPVLYAVYCKLYFNVLHSDIRTVHSELLCTVSYCATLHTSLLYPAGAQLTDYASAARYAVRLPPDESGSEL